MQINSVTYLLTYLLTYLHPALTPARQVGTRFTYLTEGWKAELTCYIPRFLPPQMDCWHGSPCYTATDNRGNCCWYDILLIFADRNGGAAWREGGAADRAWTGSPPTRSDREQVISLAWHSLWLILASAWNSRCSNCVLACVQTDQNIYNQNSLCLNQFDSSYCDRNFHGWSV